MKKNILILASIIALPCQAQKIWGKDMNTTRANFMSFMREKGYKKSKESEYYENCIEYDNIEFTKVKFNTLYVHYSATTDSIKFIEFFKYIPYRPKRFGNWESDRDEYKTLIDATFTTLLFKYQRKYPQGQMQDGCWDCSFPTGERIKVIMPPEKTSVSITYRTRYTEATEKVPCVDDDI